MFISVDGKSKEVADIFAGGTDGKAHRVTELFGSVDGIAKLVYSNEEREQNAFNQFTWAEIKQLANEGKLLEHFKQFDKVNIKLKEPLRKDLTMYMTGYGLYRTVEQVQTEIEFQIAEVTETKMRLMCPRVTALGAPSISIYTNPNAAGVTPESRWVYYASDFKNKQNSARSHVQWAWGMTPMYDALKEVQNALPDDLVNVLSVCERPMTKYTRHSITNATIIEFDEDMRVRQLSDNILEKSIDTSNDEIFYPIIKKSYFSTDVTDYMRYIRMPDEYDTYEQRMYTARNFFSSYDIMDFKVKYDSAYSSVTKAPYATWGFTDGITNNNDYETYRSIGGLVNTNDVSFCTMLPEIIIEAD